VLDLPPELEEGTEPAELDMGRIEAAIRALSAGESRMSGSAGAERAVDYIRRELAAAGVDSISTQEFPVVVPRETASCLTMSATDDAPATTVPLHALWPNLARTCMTRDRGITGPIVDVGGGTEPELHGRKLDGAIVLMEWDCDLEWLSVPEFGGKAVIFRGKNPADGRLARRKFLSMPATIPRYYVAAEDIPALEQALKSSDEATLTCDSRWEQVTARNVVAEIPAATELADDSPDATAIVFHAYYDSISVVPSLAPGAEQSCGAATLLELARYFSAHPPTRPVRILFTGGHGQALAGMTHYVKTLRTSQLPPPGLMVGLDISSRSDAFGIFCLGRFRGQYSTTSRYGKGCGPAEPANQEAGQPNREFRRQWCWSPEPA